MHFGILFSIEKDYENINQKKHSRKLKKYLFVIHFHIIDLPNSTYVAVREADIVKENICPFLR